VRKAAEALSAAEVRTLMRGAARAAQLIDQNVNTRLTLDTFLHKLPRL
jgi:hypothetical protein